MKTYDFSTIIEDCYNQALSKRNTHFAIKANKDCYTSSVAHETYDKHGLASGCVRGRGGEDIITVYKLLPRDNGTDLSKTITCPQTVIIGLVVYSLGAGGGGISNAICLAHLSRGDLYFQFREERPQNAIFDLQIMAISFYMKM